ncbi:MAG: amidohydrolase [Acidimicrobiia bacterium]|nr:amidohydrolase [Acidimicrobiia bacterium]
MTASSDSDSAGAAGRHWDGLDVVDLHVHYYTDDYVEAVRNSNRIGTYRRGDGRLVATWRSGVALTVVDPHPGPAQRLEMMDEVGIDMQVLSIPSPNAYFLDPEEADPFSRRINTEFAEIVRAHPDRFGALAMAPLQDPVRAMGVVDHAVDDLGMYGVHILSNIDGIPLDDPALDPFWEAADDRSLLVYVHPTVPDAPHLDRQALSIAVGFFNETPLTVARLAYSGHFERWPNIRWVFSHLGGTLPMLLARLDSYWRQFEDCRENAPKPPSAYARDLVFDTASKSEPSLCCAAEVLGTDRLVFGTDYPHVPGGSEPYLEALSCLGISGSDMADLLGGRARRLLDGQRI